jgi:hypothetical protein
MKQLFKIDESEKRRILEMHENATRRNYLMEQGTPAPNTPQPTSPPARQEVQPSGNVVNGKTYKIQNITDDSSLYLFTNFGLLNTETAGTPFGPRSHSNLGWMASTVGSTVGNEVYKLEQSNKFHEKDLGTEKFEQLKKQAETDVMKIVNELDIIAQNYTLPELCNKTEKPLPQGVSSKALAIAQQRVGPDMGRLSLNWCGQQKTGTNAKNKREQIQKDREFAQQRAKA